MLDFRMDTFLAACRHLNFTKAADELNMTQPAVSQHIKYLEKDYGIKLFVHEGKKMRLTKEGALLFNAVTTMKHDDIFLREKFKGMDKKQSNLIFGTTLTVGEFVMPARLAAYLDKYPDSSVRMVVANTSRLMDGISSGEIDFAIIEGYFTKGEYDYLLYSKEKYIAVCGPEYSYSGSHDTIEDLLAERLIVREPGSGTREILERILGEKNLAIHDFVNPVEISNMNAIKTIVELNCGITFLYKAAVKKELDAGRLREIKLKDLNATHDFTFVWRKGSIFAGHYRELFEILRDGQL